jgi:hypothetical protein
MTSETQSSQQFVQMSDEEVMYQEEVQKLEKRGKRLRRAALTAGIFSIISIVCTIYTTIAVRWVLIEWYEPEKTAYEISESIAMYKFGIIGDIIVVISDTLVGVLLGLILIGAGVNPATSSILIAFKLIQQSINGANVLFSIAAALMLDENLPINEVIQKYFYSDNMPPIGTQISYMFLMLNQYGHYYMQSTYNQGFDTESTWQFLCFTNQIILPRFCSSCSFWWCLHGHAWIHHCLVGCLPSLDGILHVSCWTLLHPEFQSLLVLAWI